MGKRFKKGDAVTRFGRVMNGDARTYYYQFCTVTSWGAKQGTLVGPDGEPIKVRLYSGEDDHIFYGHFEEAGRQLVDAMRRKEITRWRMWAQQGQNPQRYNAAADALEANTEICEYTAWRDGE